MLTKVSAVACTTVIALMVSSTASAQVMTSTEILKRLQMQAQSGQTQSFQGQTRGLTLDYNEEPEAEQPAAVVSTIEPAATQAIAPSSQAAPAEQPRLTAAAPIYEPVKETPAAPAPTMVALPEPAVPEARPQPTTVAVAPAYEPGTSTQVFESVDSVPAVTETVAIEAPAMATYEAETPPAPVVAAVEPSYEPGVSTQVFETTDPVYVEPVTASIPDVRPAAPAPSIVPASRQTPVLAAAKPTYKAVEAEERIDLKVYFEWNSASLRPDAIAQLAELCTAVRAIPAGNVLQIIGHTDKSGKADYNLYLSEARAREVKRHLVEECSIPEQSLRATGEGERQAPLSTPGNSPEERRVEVQFLS